MMEPDVSDRNQSKSRVVWQTHPAWAVDSGVRVPHHRHWPQAHLPKGMSFKNAEPSDAASSLHPRWDHKAQIILPSPVRRVGAKRPRLLLVEDEQPFRELLRDFLTAEGYEVQAAPDGRGGLSWMEENDVDLVVTDLCMPEVDGMELLMTIRKNSPEIPVIAMSGGVGGEMAGMLRAASLLGARRALGKPFSLQQLAAAVRESLTEMP